jgi:hypothetical protein
MPLHFSGGIFLRKVFYLKIHVPFLFPLFFNKFFVLFSSTHLVPSTLYLEYNMVTDGHHVNYPFYNRSFDLFPNRIPLWCPALLRVHLRTRKLRQLEQHLRENSTMSWNIPIYAKDIDPRIRGPFGVCKIELKEGAKPMHKKFFRCSGEERRHLNALIKKLISRGWIVPSKSEWTSQAFVVPKPADAAGNKQWRLVLDYRYLNSQTKDDPFPLPLIEDLISKQSLNRLWSIFDLEDGFHQMHLHPDSQELTAFVTPHGVYQWTSFTHRCKNGTCHVSAYDPMGLTRSSHTYSSISDDVLVGTQPVPNAKRDLLDLHFEDVSAVLAAFRKHKLFVKGVKMHLFRETIKFCGHILSNGQRRAAASKLEAIKKWTPETITRSDSPQRIFGTCPILRDLYERFRENRRTAESATEKSRTR